MFSVIERTLDVRLCTQGINLHETPHRMLEISRKNYSWMSLILFQIFHHFHSKPYRLPICLRFINILNRSFTEGKILHNETIFKFTVTLFLRKYLETYWIRIIKAPAKVPSLALVLMCVRFLNVKIDTFWKNLKKNLIECILQKPFWFLSKVHNKKNVVNLNSLFVCWSIISYLSTNHMFKKQSNFIGCFKIINAFCYRNIIDFLHMYKFQFIPIFFRGISVFQAEIFMNFLLLFPVFFKNL